VITESKNISKGFNISEYKKEWTVLVKDINFMSGLKLVFGITLEVMNEMEETGRLTHCLSVN